MKEARFYNKLENKMVQCTLCPHYCVLRQGEQGKCRGRKNTDGILYATNYNHTISLCIDPMEKKPLYHFYPGSPILSLGPNSCNLACKFCQNYHSSQQTVATSFITPENIVELCRKHDCHFVAFTYTEPFTWFEFILEAAKLLQQNQIRVVLVTNGFINPKPLQELLPHIDAMNIDLKAMEEEFYHNLCDGSLEPVLKTIRTVAAHCHLEITNLLITGENDSQENIQKIVDFVSTVNPEIPLHFSRYFPTFQLNNPPTPLNVLENARQTALKKLSFVYLGNVMTDRSTYCPVCKMKLIDRTIEFTSLVTNNRCPSCGKHIYGQF